jgi:hypothetical protein
LARSALKEMDANRITTSELSAVSSLIEVLDSILAGLKEKQNSRSPPLMPADAASYLPFPGFDSVERNSSDAVV